MHKVGIIGIGRTPSTPLTPSRSYKEMVFDAAVRAYHDAGIEPSQIDSFVPCSEDFLEGTSIFDEYTPDQLGAMLKPVHTISADGLFGVAAAYMQILTGQFDIVAVEAHSKASNITDKEEIATLALDPIYNRPLELNPNFIFGLDMARFCYETKTTPEDCAGVVVKNRTNALDNPSAPYGTNITIQDVLRSSLVSDPLREMDVSRTSDGACVIVLASARAIKLFKKDPVWVTGMGWASEAPSLETREWGRALYAELAANMAFRMAGIKNPAKAFDFLEIDDTASYKELQHMESMGICKKGGAKALLRRGETGRDGKLPVNPSGGAMGMGYLLEAMGLYRLCEAVEQVRGTAGARQVRNVKSGLVMSWRTMPTTSGAVAVLEA